MDASAIAPSLLADESTARGGPPAYPLLRKLSWLTLFRLLTITVLLGATVLSGLRTATLSEGPGPLYVLIIATYAASLVFALALRQRWHLTFVAHAQVAFDVALAAGIVCLTGGWESVFVFLFSLAIVNGSIVLFRRGAITGTVMCLGSYLPIALLGTPRAPSLTVFVHASAFVASGALAGYLAEQLRRTGERLAVSEEDLATITALHESIVQSVASGLVTIDPRGRVTFLNRAAEDMTGLSNHAVRGQPAARWFSMFEPGMTRGETWLESSRGERLRVGYTIFPLVSSDGRPLGSAVIFQDLTSIRAMEEEVKRSERLADLGRIAAGLAHEVRNPLASMTGCIELLRANSAVRGEDGHLMEIVLREAGRLEQLVAHFLTFTRPDSPRRARVDVASVAQDTLEVFANDPESSRVRIERDLTPAEAWCDADQVRQVLWNLLRNAAQSAGVREDGEGTVAVRVRLSNDRAVVVVEDNGAGISATDLQHLFTPFFTTKETGTGLGLANVQRIVDAHGGSIQIEVPETGGARFTVSFPRAPAAA